MTNNQLVSVPCQPSGSGGINNVLAVDAEHEHSSVLSEKRDFACLFSHHSKLSFKSNKKKKKDVYLGSIHFLLHDGYLISEDGSIVFNYHSLFFNVSSSK